MKATSPRDFSAKNPRTSGNSRAFSLVFSLIIMSLMLMLVLCLVALLTVEMRLSANAVDQQRARFNALASAKLALAHLQQEAGPDQRITAQANTTIAFTSVNGPTRTEVRQKWKSKNPYWTGVWDPREAYTYAPEENNTPATNGNPSKDRPPAWLVSGDAQLQTLSGERQYPSDYKTPWEVVKTDDKDTVTLFNSLPSDEDSDNSDTHPFDTKVTVSRVNFLSPDNNTIGRYAYWIADEGVKARLNMIDRFSKEQAKTTPAVSRFYAPVRAAFETFPLWDKLRFDDKTPANVFDVPGFANLFESPTQLVTNPLSNAVATYAHAVTAVSQGIMTDARHGGLKQDLSVLFELEERDFNDTPFGARGPGDNIEQLKALKGATLLFDADSSTESTASGAGVKNPRWDAFKMGIMEGGGRVKSGRPLFNVKGVLGTGGEDKDGNLLGPPWAIMRDQYRLYKEEDTVRYGGRDRPASVADDGLFRRRNYENGTFLARTWEPNATPNYQMIKTWPHTTPIFSHVVTNDEMAGKDPHTTDLYTKTGLKGVPRPMTVAATPQAVRYVLTFGLIRHGDALRFVVNPVAVVHNPYDVPMKYLEGAVPQGLGGDRAG
ncbi:MAG: hypothetical protein LBT53_04610, partial [Puniceicoccales bacterium]|nr:hypothetical protein [Puniceicoccales bacterium]